MKSLFKSLISSAMILTMSVSALCGTASAVTSTSDQSDELVSFQEYEETMAQVYTRYGIQWEVVDSSNYEPITKALLQSEVERVQQESEDYQARQAKNHAEFEALGKSTELFSENNSYSPMVMPVTANYYNYLSIYYTSLAKCTLRARAIANYDADLGHFQSISSSSIAKYSGLNCDSWTNEASQFYITPSKLILTVHYDGFASFSYTEPTTGIKIDVSVPVDTYHSWVVSDANKSTYDTL